MPYHEDYADYVYSEASPGRARLYASFGPFRFLTIVMMAVSIVLLCVCVACGLMFLADMAEDHPTRARSLLRTLILVNIAVHAAIMLVDRLSWWRSCLSILVNLLYLRVMRTFPFIRSLEDPILIATVLLVLVESAMWYWLCVPLMYYTSTFAIIAFFVYLWLVPLGLVSSCVLEEERLPGSGSLGGGRGVAGSPRSAHEPPRRKTILNRIIAFLSFAQDG